MTGNTRSRVGRPESTQKGGTAQISEYVFLIIRLPNGGN